MRRIIFALFAVMICSPSASGSVSMAEIFKRLVTTLRQLENTGSQVVFVQVDSISRKTMDTQTYTLNSGNLYSIFVLGDGNRIEDIDLTVLDENDDVVEMDNDTENIAMVRMSPKRTGVFKIGVSAFRMKDCCDDAFYAIIIARKE